MATDNTVTFASCRDRIAGTAIGAFLGWVTFYIWHGHYLLYGLSVTLCIFVCSMLAYEKAGRLAAVTLSIIVLIQIDGGPAQAALARFLEVSFGMRATHDELSTDGNVFTTTVTEFRPSGPVITSQIIFSRLPGSNGFAGQWRDTSYLEQHTNMPLRLDSQALHIDYPSVGEQIDAPLDGVEAPVRGPHALEGATFAVRPVGIREFLIVVKRHGKVFIQGSMELSNDRRIITDSWWNLDRPDDKGTLVYEKQ